MRHLVTDKDTICALATAHGIGAISVIRVSGAQATDILRSVATFLPEKLESHKIYYGFLRTHAGFEPIDEVLVSYFAQGRSFTGETSFEISCHGSAIIVDQILQQLVLAGARPARRGEFTYRAFMNGRIDLVQAESVLALIEARSGEASRLALRQLQGSLSKDLNVLLQKLTWVLAHLEANIDFASEDITIASSAVLVEKTRELQTAVQNLLAGYRKGLIIRNGYHIALVGRPNAGKSSLLNALSGEDRAIVTPIAGTTRDFVESEWSENGRRMTLIDTAGLRTTDEMVEKIGVERTLERIKAVELVMYVVDAQTGVSPEDEVFFAQIPWAKTVILQNKIDCCREPRPLSVELVEKALAILPVSAVTGAGLNELRMWLRDRMQVENGGDSTVLSHARHFEGLQVLAKSLEQALPLMLNEDSPDLIALDLQTGLRALFEVLGLQFDDQVMDRVFAEFCLGK